MKKFILTALGFAPAVLFAQQKYVIDGSLGTYNKPAKVYLEHNVDGKSVTDSVILKNGKFEFKGKAVGDPSFAYLEFSKTGAGPGYGDYKQVFLENGTLKVTSADSLKRAEVSGTKTNDDNARYDAAMKPVNDAYNALDVKRKADTANVHEQEYNAEEKAIGVKESGINKQFIKDNPNSFVSIVALEGFAYGADYTDIQPLFDGLSPEMKATKMGKEFGDRLPKLKAIAIGATAPEFAEADTAGKMVNLSSFRGKYVLVDFWASWCHPCRMENPNVVKAFNHYKGQNFTILSVSLDKPGDKNKWLAAIHKDGLTWTHVSDLKFWSNQVAVLYAVRGIPQNFLIDPQGKIIAKNLRGNDLEDKLEQLFGKI